MKWNESGISMAKRTAQYEDFTALVDVPVLPDAEKFVKNYLLTAMIGKIIAIWAFVLDMFSTSLNLSFKGIAETAAIVCLTVYIWYRVISSRKFRDILLQKCDVNKALAAYTNLISYAKGKWEIHFYNLGNILYYSGRSEDVKKIQFLLKKHCPTRLGDMYYEMLGAKLALHFMDRGELQNHCSNMAVLSKYVKLNRTMRLIYHEIMQYPLLVQMWDNGQYMELYNSLLQIKFLRKTISAQVKQNYYLYKVSAALRNPEKMDRHRTFVLQHGKDLWYCKKLETM